MKLIRFLCLILGLLLMGACAPQDVAAPPKEPAKPEPLKLSAGNWESLVAAAKQEGTVVWYGDASSKAREAITRALSDKYGINVEVLAGKGTEINARVEKERSAGIFLPDVITGGSDLWTLRDAGAFEILDPHIILPEALDPKAWPDGKPRFLDKQHTAVALTYYYQSHILINTDLVKPGQLTSQENLLNPEWKGKIVLYDPTISGTGIYWVNSLYKKFGQEWADRFFGQLVKQDLLVTRDTRLQTEWIARAKYPVAIAYSMSVVGDFLKIGAPIRPNTTKEGGTVSSGSGNVTIVNRAPHPHAAALFVNWLLSREGMALYAESSNFIPQRQDIPPAWIDPALVPPKGANILWVDEEFIDFLNGEGKGVAMKYFGSVIR